MDICLVENCFAPDGGQRRVNYEIALSAAQAGHEVTLLAHSVDPALHVYPSVHWIQMPDANWPVALVGNMRFAYATTRWLTTYGDSFDIILSNGTNTWFAPDINVVHFVHSSWVASAVHDVRLDKGLSGVYQWVYSTLNSLLERRLVGDSRTVVAVSQKVKEELSAAGIPGEKIEVVHNGVDVNEFRPAADASRAALGLPSEVVCALFAGDIRTPRKNLDSVLRALTQVPDVHLAVAGDTAGSPFPALAESLGVADRVHFLGFRRDVPDLMRAADLFVFPSRYEACTLVLLEAMASGLPIITASTAGGAELVDDDCGLVLTDPEDVEGLIRAMEKLVSEPALRASMGRAARERALQHTWEDMTEKYLALAHALCGNAS